MILCWEFRGGLLDFGIPDGSCVEISALRRFERRRVARHRGVGEEWPEAEQPVPDIGLMERPSGQFYKTR